MAYTSYDGGQPKVFNKITYIALHDRVSNPTDTTTINDFEDGIIIPAVVDDSPDFTGDEATSDPLLAIDGSTIISTVTPGTFVVEWDSANLGQELLTELLGASAAATITAGTGGVITAGKVTKLNQNYTTYKAVSFIDSTGEMDLFGPSVQLDSSLTYSDNVIKIHTIATLLTFGSPSSQLGPLNLIESTTSVISPTSGILGALGSIQFNSNPEVTKIESQTTTKSKSTL